MKHLNHQNHFQFKIRLLICFSFLYPNLAFAQSKDMVKLEWYHYIILSPILIKDAIDKGYSEITKGIRDDKEFNSLPELHQAVLRSDMDEVKKLVSSGINLEGKDKKGETALFYAMDRNQVNIARYLIENKADVNVVNKFGRSLVQPAIKNNQYDLVKHLLKHGLKLNQANNENTVLTIACNLNPSNFKFIKLFIDHGVDINHKDKNHYSALMYLATSEEANLTTILYLIKKGADVNAKDGSGRSILRLLIERRTLNFSLVKVLVENGADINAKDKDGQSIFDFIDTYYDYPETDEIVIYLKKLRKKAL